MSQSGASVAHRRYLWRWVRAQRRWPTRGECRFIVVGRWKGF